MISTFYKVKSFFNYRFEVGCETIIKEGYDEAVVEKVQAAVTIKDVASLDIYVKAEEGKAYYVINGEATGAVDLF